MASEEYWKITDEYDEEKWPEHIRWVVEILFNDNYDTTGLHYAIQQEKEQTEAAMQNPGFLDPERIRETLAMIRRVLTEFDGIMRELESCGSIKLVKNKK